MNRLRILILAVALLAGPAAVAGQGRRTVGYSPSPSGFRTGYHSQMIFPLYYQPLYYSSFGYNYLGGSYFPSFSHFGGDYYPMNGAGGSRIVIVTSPQPEPKVVYVPSYLRPVSGPSLAELAARIREQRQGQKPRFIIRTPEIIEPQ
jgi:hypothetical protein